LNYNLTEKIGRVFASYQNANIALIKEIEIIKNKIEEILKQKHPSS